jgi:hypothetical protein
VQLVELWLKEMYEFFSAELDSGHCDALVKVELKERWVFLRRFVLRAAFVKNISSRQQQHLVCIFIWSSLVL